MVGGAQFMEHVVGLDPCPLCLMQRLWTMLAGGFAIAGIAHNPRALAYPHRSTWLHGRRRRVFDPPVVAAEPAAPTRSPRAGPTWPT